MCQCQFSLARSDYMEIVPNKIPLLISKGAMKQMGMQLDFAKDISLIKGEKVRVDLYVYRPLLFAAEFNMS